jgi:hypothetical protein
MAVYSVETKLSPEEVIEKANAFFGEGGLGLDSHERSFCCVYFEGGGGYVLVTTEAPSDSQKKKLVVEFETREWDYDVKEFMGQIA